MKSIVLAITLLLIHAGAHADVSEPVHLCIKPFKPWSFTNQWEVDNFKMEVGRYKICLMAFVEEQKEAVETHKRSASMAIDAWNNFVRFELN